MSEKNPVKLTILGGQRNHVGNVDTSRQNDAPRLLQGRKLQQLSLPPELAKSLKQTKRLSGEIKATDLNQVLAKLKGRKMQIG